MELEWTAPKELPTKSWMDGSFLGAGCQAEAPQRPAPFFSEVHEELTWSWRSPYSARAHSHGTQLLTTVEGAEKLGYARPPPIKDAIAAHLASSPGWKTASLPSRPCRATAHIPEKAYISAGHAASAPGVLGRGKPGPRVAQEAVHGSGSHSRGVEEGRRGNRLQYEQPCGPASPSVADAVRHA